MNAGQRIGLGYDAHAFAKGRALVLGGVTVPHPKGLSGHSDADVLCHAIADAVLGAMGEEIMVTNEKYIDMATAISGSGPAYIFLIVETLTDAGVHIGLTRAMAEKLAVETTIGSAMTIKELKKHPAELRNMVTSPGGTTAEGLLQLESGGLRSMILKAVIAAYEKSKKLGSK